MVSHVTAAPAGGSGNQSSFNWITAPKLASRTARHERMEWRCCLLPDLNMDIHG